jgi:hypothetical protein
MSSASQAAGAIVSVAPTNDAIVTKLRTYDMDESFG